MIRFAILLYCLLMTGTGGKELPTEKSGTEMEPQIGFLVTTDKTKDMMKRAKENEKCCEQSYIESSEDGTEPRSPLVSAEPFCVQDVCSRCHGGGKKSFIQWIDDAAASDPPKGLCVAGWLFVLEGFTKYERIDNHECANVVDDVQRYYHVDDAIRACNSLQECGGFYDMYASGDFYLCKNPANAKYFDNGSVLYTKTGEILTVDVDYL